MLVNTLKEIQLMAIMLSNDAVADGKTIKNVRMANISAENEMSLVTGAWSSDYLNIAAWKTSEIPLLIIQFR